MSEVHIIDNFLNKYEQNLLNTYLSGRKILWKYDKSPSGPNVKKLSLKQKEIFFENEIFTWQIYINRNYKTTQIEMDAENNLEVLKLFEHKLYKYLPFNFEILRLQAHIGIPNSTFNGLGMTPHVDVPYELNDFENYNVYNLVYYCNDSTGDTVIFKEQIDTPIPEIETVLAKVSPKKGTAVVFNGHNYHSGGVSTTNTRKVINLNFISKDKFTM